MNKKNVWIILSWLLFVLVFVNGALLPFQFFAFRFWCFLAIVSAIICGFAINEVGKKNRIAVVLILLFLIFMTSGLAKWKLNTLSWENTAAEIKQYENYDSWLYINDLPKDTKVFYPCRNEKNLDVYILGLDKYTRIWDKEEKDFKMNYMNYLPQNLIDFAKNKEYEFLFIDGNCLYDFQQNYTRLNNFVNNITLNAVQVSKGGVLWSIN